MRAGLVNRQGLTEVYGHKLALSPAFILKEFIHAASGGLPCPSNRAMAEKYGAAHQQWAAPHIRALVDRRLIRLDNLTEQNRRRVTILFAPFAGLETDWSVSRFSSDADDAAAGATGAGRASPVNDQEIPLQRAARSEPCAKCGGARECSCARPAFIHTRTSMHLANIYRK